MPTPTTAQRRARGTADRSTDLSPTPARRKAPAGTTIVLSAGGYARAPGGDAAEIKLAEEMRWLPRTLDFDKTAAMSKATKRWTPSSANEFIGSLGKSPKPIRRIVLIGHGYGDHVGLGGEEPIDAESLAKYRLNIARHIRPRLAPGAVLDIFACNVGSDTKFTQLLADSLGVTVRSFDTGVCWCLQWSGPSGPITSRGTLAVPTAGSKRCRDDQGHCTGTVHRGVDRVKPPVVTRPRTKATRRRTAR